MKQLKPIDYDLLAQFETEEESEIIDAECASGACPVR
jgi:ribonucleoside-triphosphate reductase (thioredoxin)